MSSIIEIAEALQLQPFLLNNARAWRTYTGGRTIEQLHGSKTPADSNFPEEWIASATSARNAGREHIQNEGLSYLLEYPGVSLQELIAQNPAAFLGHRQAARTKGQLGVLIKLIDSCERLSIQVHPTKNAAQALFGSEYGKTECWHILGGRTIQGEEPCIYFGFKPGITRAHWQQLFEKQNIPGMLACLHRFAVKPGDTFLIEGGTPHAIGTGCFLAEIQEPTDYTIRTERTTPSGLQIADSMCHQGLGFEKMFDCFEYTGLTKEETAARWHISPAPLAAEGPGLVQQLVGYQHTSCFAMNTVVCRAAFSLPAGSTFSVLYVLEGSGALVYHGGRLNVCTGSQVFLPAGLSQLTLVPNAASPFKLLHCFGPKV